MYDFDKIIDRTDSDSVKFRGMSHIFGREDIIPLWVADTDFLSGEFITNALRERVDHGVFGYVARSDEYKNSVVGWLGRRTGWQIKREWIQHSPGVVTGYTMAMLGCTMAGDGVLIQPPVYNPFAAAIKANGREVINNPLVDTADGYLIDFKDFEDKAKVSKAFILCNPHNPTGRCFTREELLRMGEICLKYNVTVISDEIHCDYVYKPHRHLHFADVDERFADIAITFIAPSKSFNIAGLNTAVAITSSEEIFSKYQGELNKLHLDSANIFGTIALQEAYTHGDRWMDEMVEYLEGNVNYVVDFMKKNLPSIRCHRPDATYLMWLDFREWGMPQKDLEHFMVYEAGLALNSGIIYGKEGDGYMRVNVGSPRLVIEKAMKQLYVAAQKAKEVK